MSSLYLRKSRAIPIGQDRHIFSDASVLHGQPPFHRTDAELSLENVLQVTNTSSGPPTKSGPLGKKSQDAKPRLLLMGLRRSGKSSIASVVFHKMPPNETLFLESTTRIQKDSIQ